MRVAARYLRRCASARVILDLDKQLSQNLQEAQDNAQHSFERTQKNLQNKLDLKEIQAQLESFNLSLPQPLTIKTLRSVYMQLLRLPPGGDMEFLDRQYTLNKQLRVLMDQLEDQPLTLAEALKEGREYAELQNQALRELGNKIVQQVEAAGNRADIAGTLRIKAEGTTFTVEFSKGINFTLFVDSDTGKIEQVEDILEGGDLDFFDGPLGPALAKAYLDLIKEIQHPGSSQIGKDLYLYTARPVKDRKQYEGARTLPPNLFLANDLDHVEGLASDLGSLTRDVWRVKINTKHLVLTNDAGRIKYYQIVGDKPVPVQKLELIILAGGGLR